MFVGLILTHLHGVGDSFDLSIIPAVTWNNRAFEAMPVYAKTARLSDKPANSRFEPGPAEKFGLSDKCPATLRKSQILPKKKKVSQMLHIKKEY